MTYQVEATAYYQLGLRRVANTPAPAGQKFHIGQRVHITENIGAWMDHFPHGVDATVKYTYAHAYGSCNQDAVKEYCLDVDGYGEISWYKEQQLTAI